MDSLVNRKYITSIEGLRAIAFLGVYFSHTGYPIFQASGPYAVSIFLVLSGFLCSVKHLNDSKKRSNEVEKITYKERFLYATSKIRELWVLHIFLTLLSIPFLFIGDGASSIPKVIIAFVMNVFLIQEWLPLSLRSINGVSWYLCVLYFIYFMTPCLVFFFKKKMSIVKSIILFVICFVIQLVISFVAGFIPYEAIDSTWIDKDLTHWIVYQFPPVRFIDYIEGICIGYIFTRSSYTMTKYKYTFIEILLVVYAIFVHVIYVAVSDRTYEHMLRPGRWFIYDDIFVISSCLAVYIVARNRGYLAKLLENRIFLYIGSISGSAFLIHRVIIRYAYGIGRFIGISSKTIYTIEFTICFFLTLCASQIWIYFVNETKKRWKIREKL